MTGQADTHHVDLFIIGGGINGCGIAADASERGLKVAVCDQADLASATSGGSSKLIHGGLRYLEYYEFSMVKKALAEREVLLTKAPNLIHPMRFRIPHSKSLRPAWMIRIGLFLYDHLSKLVSLPGSTTVTFGTDSPLKANYKKGFEYSDAHCDDARLVIANALHAAGYGASVLPYHRCISARANNGKWQIELIDEHTQKRVSYTSDALVNAAGPWCSDLFDRVLNQRPPKLIQKVKGSHIVVPAVHAGSQAYLLQNYDGRVIFVIPYMGQFSLIGTTDVAFNQDPAEAEISDEEVDYLVAVVNLYFKNEISKKDIVSTYSAVRPLMDEEIDNPQAMTRDYHLEVSPEDAGPPLVSVFGGKLTTYRILSKAVVDALKPHFTAMTECVSHRSILPGNNQIKLADLKKAFSWADDSWLKSLIERHGSRALYILKLSDSTQSAGNHFGHGLYQAEVDFFVQQEWARTAEDILHRRTKLYLHFNSAETDELAKYLDKLNDDTKKAGATG